MQGLFRNLINPAKPAAGRILKAFSALPRGQYNSSSKECRSENLCVDFLSSAVNLILLLELSQPDLLVSGLNYT